MCSARRGVHRPARETEYESELVNDDGSNRTALAVSRPRTLPIGGATHGSPGCRPADLARGLPAEILAAGLGVDVLVGEGYVSMASARWPARSRRRVLVPAVSSGTGWRQHRRGDGRRRADRLIRPTCPQRDRGGSGPAPRGESRGGQPRRAVLASVPPLVGTSQDVSRRQELENCAVIELKAVVNGWRLVPDAARRLARA